MSHKSPDKDSLDEHFTELFARMREEDALASPPLPAQMSDVPAPSPQRADGPGEAPPSDLPAPRKLAGGLAAAVFLALWVTAPQPSPDAIYLEVMSANTLLTDELLLESAVVFPEQLEADDYFATDPVYSVSADWNATL